MRWDVRVRRRLGSGTHAFELDVAFRADASRVVLFGPSGAGKSVTLMAIAGLVAPDSGRIVVDGEVLFDDAARTDLPSRRRGFGYVFQDYALFPHLTVAQNVAFATTTGLANPPRRPRDPRVAGWLETFELAALADRYPDQLSGGQRQRTALARALVAEPRALLLDEPFAALDVPLRARLRDELVELQRRVGFPMILISHDAADVERFGDAVVRLAAGRVVGEVA